MLRRGPPAPARGGGAATRLSLAQSGWLAGAVCGTREKRMQERQGGRVPGAGPRHDERKVWKGSVLKHAADLVRFRVPHVAAPHQHVCVQEVNHHLVAERLLAETARALQTRGMRGRSCMRAPQTRLVQAAVQIEQKKLALPVGTLQRLSERAAQEGWNARREPLRLLSRRARLGSAARGLAQTRPRTCPPPPEGPPSPPAARGRRERGAGAVSGPGQPQLPRAEGTGAGPGEQPPAA